MHCKIIHSSALNWTEYSALYLRVFRQMFFTVQVLCAWHISHSTLCTVNCTMYIEVCSALHCKVGWDCDNISRCHGRSSVQSITLQGAA